MMLLMGSSSTLVMVAAVLGLVGAHLRGSCLKAPRSVHFRLPGYLATPIHTNECRETVTSSISPVVSLNPGELLMFRRHYSTCCCAISNTSLHEAELMSVDGRQPITLMYRRIEECVCVDCADLSSHRRWVANQK